MHCLSDQPSSTESQKLVGGGSPPKSIFTRQGTGLNWDFYIVQCRAR